MQVTGATSVQTCQPSSHLFGISRAMPQTGALPVLRARRPSATADTSECLYERAPRGELFVCESALTCHLSVHTRENTGEKVLGPNSRHTEKRFKWNKSLIKCNKCNRIFDHSAQLLKHQLIHTGEKPFTCRECGRAFKQSNSLVQHQRIHIEEKHFGCNECGNAGCQSCCLSKHQKILSGEKPFRCGDCGKSFSQSPAFLFTTEFTLGRSHARVAHGANERKHDRIHSAVKPSIWVCAVKPFVWVCAVKSSVCGVCWVCAVKPSVCGVCGKAFYLGVCGCVVKPLASALIGQHQRIHTQENHIVTIVTKPFLAFLLLANTSNFTLVK
ncbi:hypothetical protein U0070_023108 [Myodes glareolus]|uniref:C2H2-type domain-containing protein n=1 Tax=Myodes glareolus TaxID=447135 RepID=A0AAW0HTL1_MYOGA